MLNIDIHLDLSMNAMEWNRDLRLPVNVINKREAGKTDLPGRANSMVSFPELKRGDTAIVVATQIARFVEEGSAIPGWHSPEQAWAQTQGQLAWYKMMEEEGEMFQVKNLDDLNGHLNHWQKDQAEKKPIGYILSLEGADSILTPEYLERAWAYGLRAIGPAHYGPGRYANGTNSTGKMKANGIALLRKMEELNIILDTTHLCDDAFWQALENFDGHVWASHNNCRSIVHHNRQYSDEQIKALISRGAIIGAAMDAWMIVPDWEKNVSDPFKMKCGIEALLNHIDHICQLAGNTDHICIGSDLDGGFGKEQSLFDMETIADLSKFPEMMFKRGYSEDSIKAFMHGNVLRFLGNAWQ
ncbi:dipeptidase [Pollutibacter soli]|uniref:dipeptidase n=1 Tax=Pollutibacter soli TaxID=3034157 RepID=UPI0030132AA9